MAIVYQHRRNDTNEIFYIGMSSKSYNRAYNFYKQHRSNEWHEINNKCGCVVEIVATDISIEDAEELEMFLIQKYGRDDLGLGNLVNKTDGGRGTYGMRLYGESNPNYNKKWTDEQKNNMAIRKTGGKFSINTKVKMSIQRKGGLNSGAKIVLDLQTGVFYDNASELAILLNIPISTFHRWLNGTSPNKSSYIYC